MDRSIDNGSVDRSPGPNDSNPSTQLAGVLNFGSGTAAGACCPRPFYAAGFDRLFDDGPLIAQTSGQ